MRGLYKLLVSCCENYTSIFGTIIIKNEEGAELVEQDTAKAKALVISA